MAKQLDGRFIQHARTIVGRVVGVANAPNAAVLIVVVQSVFHETDSEEMNNLAGDTSKAEVIAGVKKRLAERVATQKVKPEGIEQIHFENRRRER